jgi:hypothetical protein
MGPQTCVSSLTDDTVNNTNADLKAVLINPVQILLLTMPVEAPVNQPPLSQKIER